MTESPPRSPPPVRPSSPPRADPPAQRARAGAVGISSVYPRFFLGYVTPFGGCLLAAWLFFGDEYRWLIVFLLVIAFVWVAKPPFAAKAGPAVAGGH